LSGEVLQFLLVLFGIAFVAAMWLMFIYRPRRTGEGEPRGVEPTGEPPKGDENP
jgi:hypothetical protein